MDLLRRRFLIELISAGVGLAGLTFFARAAGAMGGSFIKQGVRKIEGNVSINGIAAENGSAVNVGDRVSTGLNSSVIFVIGDDAFLLRAESEVIIDGKINPDNKVQTVDLLQITRGKLLSVFGKGRRRIVTPTAVAGVRGTGIYVEAEISQTYICTCYGKVDISALGRDEESETVVTNHHEAPRYVLATGPGPLIIKAPVKNHTDLELTRLESYVMRRPPFNELEGAYDN